LTFSFDICDEFNHFDFAFGMSGHLATRRANSS
jgi:hypothetical protein